MSNRIKSGEIQIGNSYVLPIEQTKVTAQQAKVKKIIEETDAKANKILGNAENKSLIIVETANTEATRIVEDARKRAEENYEFIKNEAYQEGFAKGEQDGLAKFQKDSYDALQALETLAQSSFDIKKNIIDSATLDIVELVAAIADKVCHVKMDEEILKQITLDAIKQLNEKESITIIVNPKLVEHINNLAESFKEEIPKLQSIKIVEDVSVSPDGVIIETLNTRLDSRISTQIAQIAQNMLTGANNDLE